MATNEEIQKVIARLSNEKISISKRDKNIETAISLGLMFEDYEEIMIEEIKKLNVNDYFKGPEKDRNPKYNGEVWIFKKIIFDKKMYIKINFDVNIRVISCHEDDC